MTVPYLGSKISLISKAEIRYEGILYSIDQNESTVALAKVKSFGTEDRPTDRPVPPRDEVFEYIIFRGRDIKDLHVCAPPQPMSHDPAIVQQSSDFVTSPGNNNNSNSALSPSINPGMLRGFQSPQSSGMPPAQMMMYQYTGHPPPPGLTPPQKAQASEDSPRMLAPIGHPAGGKTVQGPQTDLNLSFGQAPPGLSSANSGFGPSAPRGGFDSSSDGVYHSGPVSHEHQGSYMHKEYCSENLLHPINSNDVGSLGEAGGLFGGNENVGVIGGSSRGRGFAHSQQTGYSPSARPLDGSQRQNRYQQQNVYHSQQYNSPHYKQYTNYRGTGVRGHPRGNAVRRPGGNSLKFDVEFDFESSNAQFDKEHIEKELKEKLTLGSSSSISSNHHQNENANEEEEEDDHSEQPDQQSAIYYDKSKSFFDNLSCDATEKERGGRSNWREERKLNCETFGLSNSYGRGGGYYRGGRGYRSRPFNHYGHYGGGGARGGWSYSNRGMGGDRGFNRGRRGAPVNHGHVQDRT